MPARWAGPALLACLIMGVCLVGGELALRAAGVQPTGRRANPHFRTGSESAWAEPHPVLGWTNRPGRARSVEEGRAWMDFESHGRRRSRPEDIPTGIEPRATVLMVGGSFTQGYGIPDEETLAWRLSERFPCVRFENFGTGGYGGLQAALSIEQAVRSAPRFANPDLVIYGMLAVHAERNAATWSWIKGLTDAEGGRVSPPHARLAGAGLELVPYQAIPSWRLEGHSSWLTAIHDAVGRITSIRRTLEAQAITLRVLSRLVETARNAGARPVVMLLDWQDVRGPAFDAQVRHLQAAGVATPDCGTGLEKTTPGYRTSLGDGHPSGPVNARWADRVAAWLVEHGGPAFHDVSERSAAPDCRAAPAGTSTSMEDVAPGAFP